MNIRYVQAQVVPEGDGLNVKRLIPVMGLHNFYPFVLCDHFDIKIDSGGGSFPPHPHRGFEAITWLFSGGMQHKDNLGNEGTIHAGGAQRFTAGRGITHSEMPDGHAAGIQVWINLPQRLKRIDAEYQQVECKAVVEKVCNSALIDTETSISLKSMESCHLMWCFGAPHREPIHQQGLFVD